MSWRPIIILNIVNYLKIEEIAIALFPNLSWHSPKNWIRNTFMQWAMKYNSFVLCFVINLKTPFITRMKCYMFDVFGITQYYIVYAITCIGLQILTLSDYKLSKRETRNIFASCYFIEIKQNNIFLMAILWNCVL